LMRGSGYGILGYLVCGLVRDMNNGWLFCKLHIRGPNGALGALLVATSGAVILVFIVHTMVRRRFWRF